jgi:hypothetical protein
MWTHLNILFVFVISALYGQSLGFWPFDFVFGLNTWQSPSLDTLDGAAKRIAIIGAYTFFLSTTDAACVTF